MFTKSFTVAGSSLELLNPGERGIVTKFQSKDETIINKLIAMGIIPGVFITLEQRFPSFVIKAGQTRLALDKGIARAIYVRLAE
ncbi:MAG TPA: ferrous iron transport protein A [Cyanobacteria bacterium UBA8553]|nr:ferrous iron transport protein A [Cyanobacteria bacterium UBA8553]HAJ57901.1 ferrous iron transport protein A [Cyanobacteria bacterium UBA8543]